MYATVIFTMVEFDLTQSVLFEEDEIIVLNKPPGLLSIEDGYKKDLPNLKKFSPTSIYQYLGCSSP